ncbi:hypothetical protein, partial [Streptomyces sp. E5N91]|uniref:hypothetical protein n=1 Tax=Streptomyces sp. E5N91 TaxID=1851996 RepID=UPI0031BB67EF
MRRAGVLGGQQARAQPHRGSERREHGHGRGGLAPRVGFLLRGGGAARLLRRRPRLRLGPGLGLRLRLRLRLRL